MGINMNQKKHIDIDIKDYYEIKVGSIWRGLKQDSAAFKMLCFYFFMEYVHPQAIYPIIDVIPWAQIALGLTILFALFDKNIHWVTNIENKYLILFFATVLTSSIFAFNPAISWLNANIALNWLILYFLIITIVNTEKRFLFFTLLFLLLSFKMSQHGFRTFAMRGFSFAGWGVSGGPVWFRNSGEFGMQMAIFIPLSTAFILSLRCNWGRIKRIFFYLMPITGLFSIATTSSRCAQLAVGAVGIWFILKSRMGIKAVTGILITGWLLYTILPPEMFDRFHEMGKDKTSLERLALWTFALDTVREYPLLGIGYSNWGVYCNTINPEGLGPYHRCEEVHNTYIKNATELGIASFFIMFGMLLLMFWINFKTRIAATKLGNRFLFYISHGLDGGLVGYMVSCFFISALYYPFVWVHLALTVSLHEISKRMSIVNE